MPWKECDFMSERIKFISRLLDGEKMSDLCREFEISRKTGYKILNRYKSEGLYGLSNKSRRPFNRPNQTHPLIEKMIVELRKAHPSWGAPKLKSYLERKNLSMTFPAISTVHSILERNNLIEKKKRRNKYRSTGTNLRQANEANDLWCADFKGQFKLGNQKYCYPLTITDQYSRFLICCEALENTRHLDSFDVFRNIFLKYGLPKAIRTDNGVPFASRSVYGLSELSVWWLRQGIEIERIEPGHPEQNGRHERMHRTLKAETTKPPCNNILSQQERFDSFIDLFNNERPHQGIDQKCPVDLFKEPKREFIDYLPELNYPEHDLTRYIGKNGNLRFKNGKSIFISKSFKGENLGLTEISDGLWKVSFMTYDIGFFDEEEFRLSEVDNPFIKKVLPMSPE